MYCSLSNACLSCSSSNSSNSNDNMGPFALLLFLLAALLGRVQADTNATVYTIDVAIVVQSASPLLRLDPSFVDIGGTSVENTFITGLGAWAARIKELGGWPTRAPIGNATGVVPRFSVFNIGTNTTLAALRTSSLASGLPRGLYGNFSAIFLLVSTLPAVYADQNVLAGLSMNPVQPDGPCVIFYILRSTLSIFQDPATGRPRWRMLIGALVSNSQNMAALSGVLVAQHKTYIGKGVTGVGASIRALDAATETVASLKQKIASQLGIAAEQQKLLILDDAGQEMADSSAMLAASYNFNQSTIDLVQRPPSSDGTVDLYLMRQQTFAILSVAGSGSAPDMITSLQDASMKLVLDARWPSTGNSYDAMLALVDRLIILQPHVVVVNALNLATTLGLLADATGHFSELYYEVYHTQQWTVMLKYDVHNRPGIVEPFVSNLITGASAAAEMGSYILRRYSTYPPLSLAGASVAMTAGLLFQHGYSRGCTTFPCPSSQIRDGIAQVNWVTCVGVLNVGPDTSMITPLNPFVSSFVQQGGFPTPVTPSNLAQFLPRYPMATVTQMSPTLNVSLDPTLIVMGLVIRFMGFLAVVIVLDWTREAQLVSERNQHTNSVVTRSSTAEHQQRVLALQTWPIGVASIALLFGITNWSAMVMDLCAIRFDNLLPEQSLVGYSIKDNMLSLFAGAGLMALATLGLVYALRTAPSSSSSNSSSSSSSSSASKHSTSGLGARNRNLESASSVRTISFAVDGPKGINASATTATTRKAAPWRSIFFLWIPQLGVLWWQGAFVVSSLHADATVSLRTSSIAAGVIVSATLVGATHAMWWMHGTSGWMMPLFTAFTQMGASLFVSFLGQNALSYTRNVTNRLVLDDTTEWDRSQLLFLSGALFAVIFLVSFGIVLYWTQATKSFIARFLRSVQRSLLTSQAECRRLDIQYESAIDLRHLLLAAAAHPPTLASSLDSTKPVDSNKPVDSSKPVEATTTSRMKNVDIRAVLKSNVATAHLGLLLAHTRSEENMAFLCNVHWYKHLFQRQDPRHKPLALWIMRQFLCQQESPQPLNFEASIINDSRRAALEKPLRLDAFETTYLSVRRLIDSNRPSESNVSLMNAIHAEKEIMNLCDQHLARVEYDLAVEIALLDNKPAPPPFQPPSNGAALATPSSNVNVAISGGSMPFSFLERKHNRAATAHMEMNALGMTRQPSLMQVPLALGKSQGFGQVPTALALGKSQGLGQVPVAGLGAAINPKEESEGLVLDSKGMEGAPKTKQHSAAQMHAYSVQKTSRNTMGNPRLHMIPTVTVTADPRSPTLAIHSIHIPQSTPRFSSPSTQPAAAAAAAAAFDILDGTPVANPADTPHQISLSHPTQQRSSL